TTVNKLHCLRLSFRARTPNEHVVFYFFVFSLVSQTLQCNRAEHTISVTNYGDSLELLAKFLFRHGVEIGPRRPRDAGRPEEINLRCFVAANDGTKVSSFVISLLSSFFDTKR